MAMVSLSDQPGSYCVPCGRIHHREMVHFALPAKISIIQTRLFGEIDFHIKTKL